MVVRGGNRQNPILRWVAGRTPEGVRRPRTVSANGCERAIELVAMSGKGDWQSIERVLASQPDYQTRDMLIEAMAGEVSGRPKWLDQWVARRPGEYLPLLVRGYQSVTWAWEARGAQRAQYTSKRQFRLFFERLAKAREDLEEASRRAAADDPGPFALQLTMARGLQYLKPDLQALYDKVQERSPYHPVAVWSMVQGMAPKWSGSIEAMFAVAREAAAAPVGSSAHAAILSAFFEAPNLWPQQPAFALNPDEVLSAAARSICCAEHASSPFALRDHNYFLWAYWKLRDRQSWLTELYAVNGRLTAPFTLMLSPTLSYGKMVSDMGGPSRG